MLLLNEPIEIPYSIPDFPIELRSIRSYQTLVNNTFLILEDRKKRIEQLLEEGSFVEGIEDALRLARGKIMIITKNNLSTFDKLIKEARNDRQGVADLTGFWSLIVPELIDVQKACEGVEKYRRNRGRLSLSLTSSPRSSIPSQPTKTQIPAPRQDPPTLTDRNRKTTPSRGTPGLRKFLASQRRKQAQALGEHDF